MPAARASFKQGEPVWRLAFGKRELTQLGGFASLDSALAVAVQFTDAERSVRLITPNGLRLNLAAAGLLLFGGM